MCGLAVVFCSSCGTKSHPDPRRYLPDERDARRALEDSLAAWQNSPQLERTVSKLKPIMFVDQQRQPGQRLRDFSVLGESPGLEGYRQFVVKLSLEEPDQSLLVSYYVFGQGPIWVYRAEDFDMLMHMDQSMMAAAPPSADASGTKEGQTPDTHTHDHPPPIQASKKKTDSSRSP
jgi:hypothetical protein